MSRLDVACRIVAPGLGIAVLPREAATLYARSSALALVPLTDPWAKRRFVARSRPEQMRSATTRLLVEHLHRNA